MTTSQLPIIDYNHLPRLDVEPRLRNLDQEQLETVLSYEQAHRDRTPVIQLLHAHLRHHRHARKGA